MSLADPGDRMTAALIESVRWLARVVDDRPVQGALTQLALVALVNDPSVQGLIDLALRCAGRKPVFDTEGS